ncbi:MAG: ABC transporter permease [Actinobacteria bacterium]|nr:MAG: ABC transporter permease [Actinomycetota bacterium]
MNRMLSIVKKDIKQMFSNRFIAAITFLAIFAYALIYHLMPSTVNETYKMGFYAQKGRTAIEKVMEEESEEGLKVEWASSTKELKKMVEKKDVSAGFSVTFSKEGKPNARLYVSSETPKEIKEAGEIFGREFAYSLTGNQLPIDVKEEIIGTDMVGKQVPLRNDMRMMFLVVVFMVEFFALADLLAREIEQNTVFAILVTPVNKFEFLASKTITGVSLALFESLLAAAFLNILTLDILLPLLVLLAMGAFLATSIAFIVGALSKNAVSVIAWGTVFMMVLIIPAMVVLFPGLASPAVKAIPTFQLVTALDGVINNGLALSEFSAEIAYLAFANVVFFAIGFLSFRRRLAV